jgi:AcrR family transcriptional regulator
VTTPGLRERKKARTRRAIADAAISLFVAQGFDATTVEQIAAAVDVAPRTFYRYFPTKEHVILRDQPLEDRQVVEALRRRPRGESQVAALARAMRTVRLDASAHGNLRTLVRLIVGTPALLARACHVLAASHRRVVGALAGAARSLPERRRAHMVVGAYTGAFLAAVLARIDRTAPIDLRAIADDVASLLEHSHGVARALDASVTRRRATTPRAAASRGSRARSSENPSATRRR